MKQQIDQIAMWVSFVLVLLLFKPDTKAIPSDWTNTPLVPKHTNEVVLYTTSPSSHDKKQHNKVWL